MQAPAASDPRLAAQRILIVDDERGVRALCTDILRRSGCTTEAVDSASAALERLDAAEFDLALVDINLPLMSGIELCRRIRQHRASLPVVLITGAPSIESAVHGIRSGASDYVTKPFTPESLRDVIARALEKARAQT